MNFWLQDIGFLEFDICCNNPEKPFNDAWEEKSAAQIYF